MKKAFQHVKRMLPLFRAVVKKCVVFVASINRFSNILKETCKRASYAHND